MKNVIHNLSVRTKMQGETMFKRLTIILHLYNEIKKRHKNINYFINVH